MGLNIHVGITYYLIKVCKLEISKRQSLGLAIKVAIVLGSNVDDIFEYHQR